MKRRTFVTVGAATALSFKVSAAEQAAPYPSRPVTVISPWTTGSSLDAVMRAVAESMQKQSGTAFVVDNVAGAGSMIGTLKAANAKADGYTLLYGSSSGLVILPQVNSNARYDTLKAFAPISMIGEAPYLVVVPAASPFKTFQELIDAAKASPDKLTYATNGVGSSTHLSVASILSATGTTMRHVPFKGTQDGLLALLRGDVDWMLQLAEVLPMVRAGQLRLLAVTHAKRVPYAPDVPTVREALGLSGLESSAWVSLLAPEGVSPAQVQLLNGWVVNAMADPAVGVALDRGGFIAHASSPSELAETIRREHARWAKVIRDLNIKIE